MSELHRDNAWMVASNDRAARVEREKRLVALLKRAYRLMQHRPSCALVKRAEMERRAARDGHAVTDILVHCSCDLHDAAADIDAELGQP